MDQAITSTWGRWPCRRADAWPLLCHDSASSPMPELTPTLALSRAAAAIARNPASLAARLPELIGISTQLALTMAKQVRLLPGGNSCHPPQGGQAGAAGAGGFRATAGMCRTFANHCQLNELQMTSEFIKSTGSMHE
jgi:hypothetical protein